jgi:acetylornithine aminotransferase
MAFRTSLRLVAAARSATSRPVAARFYSQATAVPTSSASSVTAAQIKRDAALPNPDPAEDSASAALVREHAPYMVATYARPPPIFVKGEGSYLYDIENKKYLDFTAGIAVNSLGHCDPEISTLIAQQVTHPSLSLAYLGSQYKINH